MSFPKAKIPACGLDVAEVDRLRAAARDHLLFYGREFSDVIVAHASGAYMYDTGGRAILDFSSGQMCATVGHNHPVIKAALQKSADEVIHLDSTKLAPSVIALAVELCRMLPPQLQQVMFLNTGSESNEAAIRLAKLHTGRFEIVALNGSWHGMTAGSQSSTYASARRGYGPAVPGTFVLPPPNAFRCPIRHCRDKCDATCLDVGFELFDGWSVGEGAAVIVEPIQSANGMIVPPEGYLKRLKQHCAARGMLLVFDEAQTGLGRVGTNFAFESEEVVPDFLTLSKTLGAGVPLSAVVTSPEIGTDARAKEYSFYTSHVSDPMPAEVGLAVVRLILTEQLAERAKQLGNHLQARLDELKQRHEVVGDVRGRGLLIGVELVEDRQSRRPAHELMQRVTVRCLELGLNVNRAGGPHAVWRIAPPLTIEKHELDSGVAILDEALSDCTAR
jgi:2,2-dialkylglycine decarboxylase (pyruvate)